ncbi:hypothetical protein Ancab_023683 [Ancistrocladus abbreviatus]
MSEDPYFASGNQYINTRNGNAHGGLNLAAVFAVLICFSFLVVILLVVHIYARCFLQNQARQDDHQAAQQVQEAKTGLHKAVIASLPTFVFKQWDGDCNKENSVECAVCLSVLEKEDMARLLPDCKHIFHASCIDKWLISGQLTCPVCRAEVTPRQLPPLPPEPPERAALHSLLHLV